MLMLALLIQLDLRSGQTVRWIDGGFARWEGQTFLAADPAIGVFEAIESVEDGAGNSVPDLTFHVLPSNEEAAAIIADEGNQGSRARFWVAELDSETGAVIGTPERFFDGQLDEMTELHGDGLKLSITVVSTAERLFAQNEGNTLSAMRHKAIWPGELGEDNAHGVSVGVAWGAPSPAPAFTGAVSGGGGRSIFDNLFQRLF